MQDTSHCHAKQRERAGTVYVFSWARHDGVTWNLSSGLTGITQAVGWTSNLSKVLLLLSLLLQPSVHLIERHVAVKDMEEYDFWIPQGLKGQWCSTGVLILSEPGCWKTDFWVWTLKGKNSLVWNAWNLLGTAKWPCIGRLSSAAPQRGNVWPGRSLLCFCHQISRILVILILVSAARINLLVFVKLFWNEKCYENVRYY